MQRSVLLSYMCGVLCLACGKSPGSDGPPADKAESDKSEVASVEPKPEPAKPEPSKPEPTKPEVTPPEPTPEPTTATSRLPIPPTPDLAVVRTATGVEVLDDTGKSLATLLTQPINWCRVDPRAEVLWFRQESGELGYLDLRTTDPATTLLASSPDTIVIDYGDEKLGMPEGHEFEDGLVVHMLTPVKVEAVLGCEGDMAFQCFGDEEEDPEAAGAKRLEQRQKDLAAQSILAPDKLAALVTRSAGRRATLPDPALGPEPTTVANVPKEACEEAPEDCGGARRLTGTPYWLVLVANSRGDFYHEVVQLYDPAKSEFFDPLDPTRRSATPLDGEDPFMPTWVSPSGTMLSDDTRVAKLGSGAVAKELTGVCGFWGGGWETDLVE